MTILAGTVITTPIFIRGDIITVTVISRFWKLRHSFLP